MINERKKNVVLSLPMTKSKFIGEGEWRQGYDIRLQCFSKITQHAATPHVRLPVTLRWLVSARKTGHRLQLNVMMQPLRHASNVPLAMNEGDRGARLLVVLVVVSLSENGT